MCMMDDNSCKSVKIESAAEVEDWRSELKPEVREKIVNEVIEKLKNHVPSSDPNTLNEINKVAVKFEEKIYHTARTKDGYLIAICKKITPIENSCNQSIAASSPNPGLAHTTMPDAVGNCSSLQNMAGFLHDLVGNSVGQGMQSNILANSQKEIQGSKPLLQAGFQLQQQQQLQHQLLKQKVQQPNIHSSFMQPNLHYSHHHQQQQQSLPQPTQLQTSQQSLLPTQQNQQLIVQQSNTNVFQQKHQLGQQSSVSLQQQLPLYQQKISNSFQQQLGPQSNISGPQQQQKMFGSQSDAFNAEPQQHSVHILQQVEVTSAQQKAQQASQPVQLHQVLCSQQNDLLQTSAALLQPQNANDQQKQLLQSQNAFPEASSASMESTAQIQRANVADWHDQAYQKLQSMRGMCLPELIRVYKRAHAKCLQETEPETVKKWENHKIMFERMIKFIQMPRSDIVHCPKEKWDQYHHMIINYFSSIQKRNPVSVQHHDQQFQSPGSQSQIPQLLQQRNTKLQFHPANIPLTSTSVGSSPLLSTQQGDLNLINRVSSLPSISQRGSEQRNAPSPLQHGSVGSIHQNILSAPQQTNSSHNTSGNASHTSINLIQPTSASIPFHHLKQQQKHQMIQPQKLKQQMQQQWIQQKRQQMLPQKMYEVNDLRVRQSMGVSSGMLQQQQSTGQQLDALQSLLPTTPRQPHATSPQTSQHSSPLFDQQNLLSPVVKAAPLQSASSPFIVASPSTPLTPSSIPVDLEKNPRGVSPLSIVENAGPSQTPVSVTQVQTEIQTQNQSLAIGATGLSVPPLLTEFTSPDGNQQSRATVKPLERLLKAVKSMSPTALSASVSDIGSVLSMIDTIAGTTTGKGSRIAIGDDLLAKTRCRLQAWNFSSHYGCAPAKRMKCHMSAMVMDPLSSPDDSFKQPNGQISDPELTATSKIKRRRTEVRRLSLYLLLLDSIILLQLVCDCRICLFDVIPIIDKNNPCIM
ncbi:hypothetical protein L1049_008278 [Liquidambar formosana]|uniref:Mediator complex subunit 15 KIX domain-containing protein n=1 Tax=Liquidambar formosana TaxID=63359 RepID=A0AAP0S5X3_LIQFO